MNSSYFGDSLTFHLKQPSGQILLSTAVSVCDNKLDLIHPKPRSVLKFHKSFILVAICLTILLPMSLALSVTFVNTISAKREDDHHTENKFQSVIISNYF